VRTFYDRLVMIDLGSNIDWVRLANYWFS